MPPFVYIIIAIVIIIALVFLNDFLEKLKLKSISTKLEIICDSNNFTLLDSTDKRYDKRIETNNTVFYIKYVIIPKNSSITINSKDTWCLRYGGGNRKGRNYPNKEYMNYLKSFLNAKFENEKNIQKLVILYPSTEVVLKYLNESDIAVVKFNTSAYDVKLINYTDLDSKFIELTK